AHRLLHEEAHADDQVVVLGGEVGQVRHVVVAALRLLDVALDVKVGLRLLEADVGKVVEALVVEAADVGDQTDLDDLRAGGGRATAGSPTAGHGKDGGGGDQDDEPEALVTHPHRSLK